MTLNLTCDFDLRILPRFFSSLHNRQRESRYLQSSFKLSCGQTQTCMRTPRYASYMHVFVIAVWQSSQIWKKQRFQADTVSSEQYRRRCYVAGSKNKLFLVALVKRLFFVCSTDASFLVRGRLYAHVQHTFVWRRSWM